MSERLKSLVTSLDYTAPEDREKVRVLIIQAHAVGAHEERERTVALAERCRDEFRPGDERGEDFRRYADKFIDLLKAPTAIVEQDDSGEDAA